MPWIRVDRLDAPVAPKTVEKELVIVTGAGGFIGSYVVAKLIKAGYRVRAAELFPERCTNLHALVEAGMPFELVKADLLEAEAWPEVMKGASYVVHMAAVVVMDCKESEAEETLIKPGLLGTLNVLRAAAAAGIKRTVMTSSLGAIGSPWELAKLTKRGAPIDGSCWTDPVRGTPYCRAKAIAEKAAWDFVESPEANGMQLVSINPGVVIGPSLNTQMNESMRILLRIIDCKAPALPDIMLPVVHVSDVADAHVAALSSEKAVGKRFLMVKERTSLLQIGRILKPIFKPLGYRVPTKKLPTAIMKIAGTFDVALRRSICLNGLEPVFDCAPAQEVFGLPLRTIEGAYEQMIIDAVDKGFLRRTPQFDRWRSSKGTMAASTKQLIVPETIEGLAGADDVEVEVEDLGNASVGRMP